MDGRDAPLVLIEIVLVFGGALLFGWWQLRSVARDQARTCAERARREQAEQADGTEAKADHGPPA